MDRYVTPYQSPRAPHVGAGPPQSVPGESTGYLWDILRRHVWLVIVCTILSVAAALLYVKSARPTYRAAASLRIDDRQERIPALSALGLGGTEVSTEVEMLRSRMLAEDVVDSLGLQLQITTPRRVSRAQVFPVIRIARTAPAGQYTLEPFGRDGFLLHDDLTGVVLDRVVAGSIAKFRGGELLLSPEIVGLGSITFSVGNFDDAVKQLQGALSIERRSREANLVDVAYRGTDPELVRAVPDLLVSRFISDRQQAQQSETRSTAAFLREQTGILAGQLQAAEDTLRRFREVEHIVSLPEQASSGVIHLADLRAQRNELDAERGALAQLLRSGGDSGSSSTGRTAIAFPTLLRNQAGALLLSSLAELENRRSELLSRRSLQDEDVQVLTRRIDDLRSQLRGIASTYLQGLTNQIAAIDNTLVTSDAQLQTIPAKEIRVAELNRNVSGLEQIYTQLQTQLKGAEVAEAAQDPSVRLVDAALVPRVPVSPQPTLSLALALVTGLIIGLSGALVSEYRDRAVHTRQDVLAATGVPVLGVIPHGDRVPRFRRLPILVYKAPRELAPGRPVKTFGPGSQEEIAEAFVRLATNVDFAGRNGPIQVLMVTSALPGEGKTTSAVNLALASARRGVGVLLIDADLRRGAIHELLRLPRAPGFSEVLAGLHPFEQVVRRVEIEGSKDLHVLTMGTVARNPSQLLLAVDLAALFGMLRLTYEMIVIDSSPMNVVADATLFATISDGVIVVARAGMTVPESLSVTLEQLSHVNASVVGTVLNDMDYRRDGASRKAYKYHGSYLVPQG